MLGLNAACARKEIFSTRREEESLGEVSLFQLAPLSLAANYDKTYGKEISLISLLLLL
jgi:hypothetical protein